MRTPLRVTSQGMRGATRNRVTAVELAELFVLASADELRRRRRRTLRKALALTLAAVFGLLTLAGAGSAAGAMLFPALAVALLAPLLVHR